MKALHSASGTGIGYNPGISYRGGELLGAGIAQAGNALAQGFERFAEQREREREEQKTRAREFKALQEFADATGIAPKDQTTTMDLDSLRGFVRGAEGKRAIEEQQRRAKLEADRFGEQQRSNRVREDLAWLNRMDAAGQRSFQNVQALERARREEADFGLRQRTGNFTLGQAEQEAAQREQQRIATLEAIRAMQADPAYAASPLARLSLGSAAPDVKALGDMRELMAPVSVPGSLQDVPGAPGYKFGVQSRTGAGSFLPVGQSAARSVDPLKLEQEIRATTEAYTKSATPAERGAFLDQLRRLESLRNPVSTPAAPAAPAARPATANPTVADKVVVEKDGKKFRLPKAQLEQAQREGYKLVP